MQYDLTHLNELHARLEDGVTRALAEGDYQSAARHAYAIDAVKKWQAAGFEGPPPADAQELAGMELAPLPEEPPALPDALPPDEPASFDLDLDALLPPDEQALAAQLAAGQEALAAGRTGDAIAAFDAVADQAQSSDLRLAALSALVRAQRAQLAAPVVAAGAGPANYDPGLERRLRRSSLLSGLVSAMAMAMLLLTGGWLLARSLEPTGWEIELAATEHARAVQSAVAVSFAVQQETVDARATAAAQATQAVVDATATAVAQEMAAATATAAYAPTATVIAEATATAEALAAMLTDDFAIVWPEDGAAMAVAPWQVVVRSSLDQWPDGSYTLLLNDQPIHQFSAPRQDADLVYTRSIDSFFDGFPRLSSEIGQLIGLDENGQLPVGSHRLQAALDQDGDGAADRLSRAVSFVIDPALRWSARVVSPGDFGISRLETPRASQGRFPGQGILNDELVEILGKVVTLDLFNDIETWYLWQAGPSDQPGRPPVPERRGWSLTNYFQLDENSTIEEVPDLALPATSSTSSTPTMTPMPSTPMPPP